MIHFTCDLCGRSLRDDELRYEVRIEVRVALDGDCGNGGAGDLPGEEPEAPGWIDEDPADLPDEDLYRGYRFDLCARCHAAFLSDPLPHPRRLPLRHFEN